MILLVHPPVVKPCEPPAGIAKLSGALRRAGVKVSVLDANLEGLLSLLEDSAGLIGRSKSGGRDRWTERASRNLSRHLDDLRRFPIYDRPDRYRRAVADLDRLLEQAAASGQAHPRLGNFTHERLLPVRSGDLLEAAERPEENPFHPYFSKRLTTVVERECPSHVGFSLNYLSQALSAFAMIGFLKKTWPQVSIILGGGLVTTWLSRPDRRNPFGGLVDHLVPGAGEEPLLSILKKSASGRNLPALPDHAAPDYSGFPLRDYFAPGPILPYSASRGCYWRQCAFCPEKAEDNPYLPLPPERVLSDLDELCEETRPVLIHLLDNALSPKLLDTVVDRPPGAPWYGFVRITANLADPGFCRALRRSGCAMLKLGLESGDQAVLDRLGKGIDLAQAGRALQSLKAAGIPAYVYLLFGTPAEDHESARRTLDFVVRHSDGIAFLNVAVFNLPIFSPDFHKLETRDFYRGDLSLYADFSHPLGWQRSRVRVFLDREFKRHPAVSAILRRDPPVFTSNHAPFFPPGAVNAGENLHWKFPAK